MGCAFDFDKIVNRRHTGSLKWDHYDDADAICMWLADMDFQAPAQVIAALHRQVDHGIFGYPKPTAHLTETIVETLKTRYDWSIEPSWLVWLPSLVSGLNLACRAVGGADDEVVTFTPIYPPFLSAPALAGRKLLTVPLAHQDGRWFFDLEKLQQSITDRTQLLLVCSPHNPVGRSYSREELHSLAEFCLEKNLFICSDEIHCDLILDHKRHVPTATLSAKIAERTITLMSPAKTYNLAGLGCGFAVISNEKLRRNFIHMHRGIVPEPNVMGYTACLAAYRCGEPWRQALLEYLRANRDLVYHTINREIPPLSMDQVEATYLAWINTQELDTSCPSEFFRKAGVILHDGRHFGAPGYLRLNFACPRTLLSEALQRMKQAVLASTAHRA